jgi:nucleotide-binding universal stress UspA family protein
MANSPGADMALYLARHGVKIEVMAQKAPAGLDVGNALLSLAADLGSDLIAMGGYGHMRWRGDDHGWRHPHPAADHDRS